MKNYLFVLDIWIKIWLLWRFYSLTRLVETDADGIPQKGVIPTLNEMELTPKLLSLGADGAAVMCGQHSGVIANIQEIYPEMIYIHCAAQRLNIVIAAYFNASALEKYGSFVLESCNQYRHLSVNKCTILQI